MWNAGLEVFADCLARGDNGLVRACWHNEDQKTELKLEVPSGKLHADRSIAGLCAMQPDGGSPQARGRDKAACCGCGDEASALGAARA